MHCAACSSRIEKVVGMMAGVESVSVNLATESMDLAWNPELVQPADIAARIGELGFTMVVATEQTESTLAMAITGMNCAACSSRIEKVVGGMEGVRRAEVNLAAETASFVFDPTRTSRRAIRDGHRPPRFRGHPAFRFRQPFRPQAGGDRGPPQGDEGAAHPGFLPQLRGG